MSDSDPPSSHATDRRVTITRLSGEASGNYRIEYSGKLETAVVGWLSFQPSGIPLAFGDAPAALELGGTGLKTVKFAGDPEYTDDGEIRAVGARIELSKGD